MAKDDSSQNSNDGKADDLTVIKGIKSTQQQWLTKTFDVRTFSGLAALSDDRIETALKAKKRPKVSRSEIDAWIIQARELASDGVSQQAAEAASSHSDAPLAPEQAESAEASPAEAPPVAEPDIAIQVTQVQLRQPLGAQHLIRIGQPDQPFPGVISSAEPFEIGVSFEVTGAAASDKIEKRTSFTAEFHARDLRTGASLHLGHSMPGHLIEGASSFVATLSSAKLPQGAYRMQVLVSLQSTPLPGYFEAPKLQVL